MNKCLSNYHGCPKRIYPACIDTTSHITLCLYFTIENKTSIFLFTSTSPQSFSHCSLYSIRCFKVVKFNFSTKLVLAILVQLPPSIIMLYLIIDMAFSVKDVFTLYFLIFFNLHIERYSWNQKLSINWTFNITCILQRWMDLSLDSPAISIFPSSFKIIILLFRL